MQVAGDMEGGIMVDIQNLAGEEGDGVAEEEAEGEEGAAVAEEEVEVAAAVAVSERTICVDGRYIMPAHLPLGTGDAMRTYTYATTIHTRCPTAPLPSTDLDHLDQVETC